MLSCIEVRTKPQLQHKPEQQAAQLDRHHRALMSDATTLEEAIVAKRRELEGILINIELLEGSIEQREAMLASMPEAQYETRRQAAHALYESIADEASEASSTERALSGETTEATREAAEAAAPQSEAGKALDFLRTLLPVQPAGTARKAVERRS